VIQIGDDDFVAVRLNRPSEREADHADERRGIHAEGHFRRIGRVQPGGDFLTCRGDDPIDLAALFIAPAALNVCVEQVVRDCVEHVLWHLSARRIVEIDERRRAFERWKFRSHGLNGKLDGHRSSLHGF
jgi:hypothetical protein